MHKKIKERGCLEAAILLGSNDDNLFTSASLGAINLMSVDINLIRTFRNSWTSADLSCLTVTNTSTAERYPCSSFRKKSSNIVP